MSDKDLLHRATEISVYARVTAQNKLRIVRALQANGAVVAMTGDGVNDAPAIQGADIGIAMGRAGTEVTKQAADMIITDDNFATIVAAIEEGRGIYDNITKTLQYLLAGNTGELLLMTLCVFLGLPSPLMPIHLLWINLVTDGLPALCLATDNSHTDAMQQKPRKQSDPITNASFVGTMVCTGILTAGVAFAVYLYDYQYGNIETARASAFTVLVFAELLRAFGARSRSIPIWQMKPIVNFQLLAVVLISFGLQVWSQHSPTLGAFLKTTYMSIPKCLLLFALSSIPTVTLELWKFMRLTKETSGDAV